MPLITKINEIFVDIKADDCSVSVHINEFELFLHIINLFLHIINIVTKGCRRRQESTRQPCFYSAGIEISRFLSIFVIVKSFNTISNEKNSILYILPRCCNHS